eukprot:UN2907
MRTPQTAGRSPSSSASSPPGLATSRSCLVDDFDRVYEGQNDFYLIDGESIPAVSSPPFLDNLRIMGL